MAFEHYDKCSLLLPMDGANNGTDFPDWSPKQKAVAANGNAKTVTAQSKYYGSSGYFDGAGDYLLIQNHSDFNIADKDFCMGLWIRMPSAPSGIQALFFKRVGVDTQNSFNFYINNGDLTFSYTTTGSFPTVKAFGTAPITINTWHHIEINRAGSDFIAFFDGTQLGSVLSLGTDSIYTGTSDLRVGAGDSSPAYFFNGYIQDLFIIRDAYLHTSDFTPPPRLIGELSNANALAPVEDETGTPAERTIIAVPRNYPTRAFGTVSDVNGDFTLRAPATECSVFAIHEGTPIKNDIIQRVIPV